MSVRLALLRHGIAEDEAATDFERRLTEEGREELLRLVDELADMGWKPGAILHSPLVRTAETAAIVHRRFPQVPKLAVDEIAYGDLPAILYATAGWSDPLLVGHEPTMGRLAARLVGAPPGTMRFDRAGFGLFELDQLPPSRPGVLVYLSPPRRRAVLR